MLAGEKKNICVVGDDDQGMYRFRGATIRNILEFPDKIKNGECKTIHLDINYRSEPDIISFYNRWMKNVDGLNLFNWNRYRYEKTIRPGKTSRLVGSSVYVCGGDSLEVEKAELLEMVKRLKNNGNITNYNQIAFLFRSVKSNEAIQIGQYFEENGIPVYSPRSEMFFQRTEVMMLIGCLILCFQNYVLSLKVDQFTIRIFNELREHYKSCLKLVLSAQNKYPEFDNVKSVNNKTIYSFTSHIAIFDDCPRQYCFFKEYGFAKSFQVHTSVGSLVHATLEEMNRYIIAGHEHLLNDEVIEEWFSIHYSKMQEHTGIELTPEQKENTLRQVLNYYHLRKDEIVYAWKAEDEIIIVLPDFILQAINEHKRGTFVKMHK